MKIVLISLMKGLMNLIYLPIKCRKTKNKIVYLSRQNDSLSLDMQMLSEEISRISPETSQVFRLQTIKPGIAAKIKYLFFLLGDMYHLGNASVAVCDTYSIPVSCLKHKKELYIIQMWHAMGAVKKFGLQSLGKKEGRDEAVSKAMNMHKNYHCVFAPSKQTAEFYAEAFGTDIEKMQIFTLPRIDYLLQNQRETKGKFLRENPVLKNQKIVLYLPTFREGEEDIIKNLYDAFQQQEQMKLIVSVHPLSELSASMQNGISGIWNTYDLMKIADVIITDYSACAFEASILNKPLYFYVPDYVEYSQNRGVNICLKEEMADCVFEDAGKLREAIISENYSFEEVAAFREKYVENTEECTEKMAEYICGILNR